MHATLSRLVAGARREFRTRHVPVRTPAFDEGRLHKLRAAQAAAAEPRGLHLLLERGGALPPTGSGGGARPSLDSSLEHSLDHSNSGGDDGGAIGARDELLRQLDEVTSALVRLEWRAERPEEGAERPPLQRSAATGAVTQQSLARQLAYFESQLRLRRLRFWRRQRAVGRARSATRRVARERSRAAEEKGEARDALRLLRTGRRERERALNSFRAAVRQATVVAGGGGAGFAPPVGGNGGGGGGFAAPEGFPPRDAIYLGTIPPFHRQLWVYNGRDAADGRRRPCLLLLHPPSNNALVLDRVQLDSLENCLPQLKKAADTLLTLQQQQRPARTAAPAAETTPPPPPPSRKMMGKK